MLGAVLGGKEDPSPYTTPNILVYYTTFLEKLGKNSMGLAASPLSEKQFLKFLYVWGKNP